MRASGAALRLGAAVCSRVKAFEPLRSAGLVFC
jgi:hypothetical protein